MTKGNSNNSELAQKLIRNLVCVWTDFESRLIAVPIIRRVMDGQIRIDDYRLLLLNHRQQVIEGGRWIALASSSITHEYAELRSRFIQHAATEHRDYLMLENDYQSVGGSLEEIRSSEKNIGSEALSAWMFYRAGQVDPFDLMGAMFIIEGLGKTFSKKYADKLQEQLQLEDRQVSFYRYHSKQDENHLNELEEVLQSGILEIDGLSRNIVKTARVTARLYLLQLEEIGNY